MSWSVRSATDCDGAGTKWVMIVRGTAVSGTGV